MFSAEKSQYVRKILRIKKSPAFGKAQNHSKSQAILMSSFTNYCAAFFNTTKVPGTTILPMSRITPEELETLSVVLPGLADRLLTGIIKNSAALEQTLSAPFQSECASV
jgi:hypothetical protein